MGKSRIVLTSILACLIGAAGCGKPFNIKPRTEVKPPAYNSSASPDSVNLEAIAITDEDFLYDTFNANLILAGVLPVRIRVTNKSERDLRVNRKSFDLRAGRRGLKAIEADNAYKRLISFYGVKMYNKAAYKEAKADLSSYQFNWSVPIKPEESREGLVFFEAQPPVESGTELVLRIKGLGSASKPLDLKLK